MFQKIIMLLILTGILGFGIAQKTLADCPNGTGSPDDITCTSTDTNGSALGGGNDTLVIEDTASVTTGGTTISIQGGNGDDRITNNGTITSNNIGIDGGAGADSLINNGTITANNPAMFGGTGNDTLINNGTITGTGATNDVGMSGGDNNDTLTNNGSITTNGDNGINGGIGDDKITNNSTINAPNDDGIDTGTGTDIVINTGTIVAGVSGIEGIRNSSIYNYGSITGGRAIFGGLQQDFVVNEGILITTGTYAVDLDKGDDTLTNAATIQGMVYGNGGNDVVNNTGSITGTMAIDMGDGNDTVINDGSLTGTGGTAVQMGNGNDTFTTEAGAVIVGIIDGGANTDTITFTGTTYDAAGYNQVQAYVACNPCSGTVTIDGHSYTFQNFEQLVNLITLLVHAAPEPALVSVAVEFDPPTLYDDMGCQNGVQCYALKDNGIRNGNVQIFASENGQGTPVATVNFNLLGVSGYSYTNPNMGWTVTISYLGSEGDARLYNITISKGNDVRNAGIQVLAFGFNDANPNTNTLAWR